MGFLCVCFYKSSQFQDCVQYCTTKLQVKEQVLTMYSEGAINSMVADLISGLLCGSPYVLVTGSKENSSGTAKDITDLNLWSISKFQWTSENKNRISLCDDPEPPPPPFMFMYMSSFCMKTQLPSYPVKGSCLTNSGEQKKRKREIAILNALWKTTLPNACMDITYAHWPWSRGCTSIDADQQRWQRGWCRCGMIDSAQSHWTGSQAVAETESTEAETSRWNRVHRGWS